RVHLIPAYTHRIPKKPTPRPLPEGKGDWFVKHVEPHETPLARLRAHYPDSYSVSVICVRYYLIDSKMSKNSGAKIWWDVGDGQPQYGKMASGIFCVDENIAST
ncbi:MAG: hypothetical protein ACI30R_08125, partial [Sodaliphilus sp.]